MVRTVKMRLNLRTFVTLQNGELVKENAFTLIELVLTLAVLAIVLSIAIPNFSKYAADYQIESQINSIASDIQYARYYALTHRVDVVFTLNNGYYNIKYIQNGITVNLKTVQIKYPMSMISSNGNSLNDITFDMHGFEASAYQSQIITIKLNESNTADPNCINLKYTSVNTGVLNNEICQG